MCHDDDVWGFTLSPDGQSLRGQMFLSICMVGGAFTGVRADRCGNGVIDPGEGCDDGNTTTGDGCDDIRQPEGVRGCRGLGPIEECDDGNTVGGDFCEPNCTRKHPGQGHHALLDAGGVVGRGRNRVGGMSPSDSCGR